MEQVVRQSWALLLGVLLLLIGNGLQGTVVGVRGAIEGFDARTMSFIMSAYFAGFLLGSRAAPVLIRNVGHVRVFAALASLISSAFILYAASPSPWLWMVLRLIVGFCYSGVYVVAESWLNESVNNESRGKALSLYAVVQMAGLISAQFLLNLGDPGGYVLFIVMSVLVSVSFLPILLSVSPAPVFSAAKRMTLRELFAASPLGCVSILLLGGILSSLFGMAPVYGTEKGMSIREISIFVSAIFAGGLIFQFPIGIASDRMDRRVLIIGLTAAGFCAILIGLPFLETFWVMALMGFMVGGVANPLYSLIIAYTNDHLDYSDMAAASSGLVFMNGVGAMFGPIVVGVLMRTFGADAFFYYNGALFSAIASYALYRSSQRPAPSTDDTASYAYVNPQASVVAVEGAYLGEEDAEAGSGEPAAR